MPRCPDPQPRPRHHGHPIMSSYICINFQMELFVGYVMVKTKRTFIFCAQNIHWKKVARHNKTRALEENLPNVKQKNTSTIQMFARYLQGENKDVSGDFTDQSSLRASFGCRPLSRGCLRRPAWEDASRGSYLPSKQGFLILSDLFLLRCEQNTYGKETRKFL